MGRLLVALLSGAIFGLGLALSGMTQPAKIVRFLDFTGAWDPTLVLVMCGAVGVYMPLQWLARRRGRTLGGLALLVPTRNDLDPRLLAGSALFGIGWGIGGICPGPALTTLGAGTARGVLFAAAMLAGMLLFRVFDRLAAAGKAAGEPKTVRLGAAATDHVEPKGAPEC